MIKLITFFLLFLSLQLSAQTFVLSDTAAHKPLWSYLEYYKDTNASQTKESIDKLSQKHFYTAKKQYEHMGLSFITQALWAKVNVKNTTKQEIHKVLWFKNINYKTIILYKKTADGFTQIKRTSDINDFYFHLTFEPNTNQEYIVSFHADGPYIINTKLLTSTQASQVSYESGLFFAAFSMFICIAVIFYLVLFIGIKESMYFYFSLYLISHLLLWLGIFGVYRPIDFSTLKIFSFSLSSISIALVSFRFLHLKQKQPLFFKLISLLLIGLLSYFFSTYYFHFAIFQPIVFASFYITIYILIFTATVRAIRSGYKTAYYFFFATLGYLLGQNITIGGVFASAKIPANDFTLYIGMLGTVIDVIFASIAFVLLAKTIFFKQKKQLEIYNHSLEEQVERRTKKIKEQNLLLEKLSTTDTLTQLANRAALDSAIETAFHLEQNTYLILIDIDFFKQVNDNYGHLVGDSVLKQLATILTKSTKEADFIGRWGGEEFLLLIKVTDDEKILNIAERIRKNVEASIFEQNIKVSISLGVSSKRGKDSVKEWIAQSDKALYQAKEEGRNKIVFFK